MEYTIINERWSRQPVECTFEDIIELANFFNDEGEYGDEEVEEDIFNGIAVVRETGSYGYNGIIAIDTNKIYEFFEEQEKKK